MIARNRRTLVALGVALGLTAPTAAQERDDPRIQREGFSRATEPVNERVIAQIKAEGFQHSAVMETLSWLADVHGPRLTGSPALRAAGEWARNEMTRWGLANAALESYGSIGRGWALEKFSIEMTEPQFLPDHRLSAGVVAGDAAAARRDTNRRRSEVEGRLRQVPREARAAPS